MTSLVDNDVLLKAASYNLLDALVIDTAGTGAGYLGAARFMLPKKLSKLKLETSRIAATAAWARLLESGTPVEPSDDETSLAALFESAAQKVGVPLDGGESLLCAVLIHRSIPLLLTGDKRAIRALEVLADHEDSLASLFGRLRCLEQLVRDAILRRGLNALRPNICAEPEVDKTLTLVFACSSDGVTVEGVQQGLSSYIEHLRRDAPRMLQAN